ncbi:tRNA pseudouridine38-40 synthase [Lachnospiraceae bacterium RM5]|nr:tRNA pseudouridine38-40 synthase [Lachnospiraceae bacterium RM5]
MKNNYKMSISYDGTRFFGWEHQPGKEWTIQGKIETVLAKMLGMEDGEIPKIIAAGRTDAGVHAKDMTINCIMETDLSPDEIKRYLNRYLPEDISVNEVKIAAERFHARYKALGKTYCYTLYYGDAKPVFDRKYVYVLEKKPDVEKMREAAKYIIGTKDFKSFCGNSHMKKSTVRMVDSIEIKQKGPYIRIYYHGNGFLQNMVRIMTGTLLEVAFHEYEPEHVEEIIEAKDRHFAGFTAPAMGLTLIKVDY